MEDAVVDLVMMRRDETSLSSFLLNRFVPSALHSRQFPEIDLAYRARVNSCRFIM
jgi:hypothetical protein